jgi:hypothetical protein
MLMLTSAGYGSQLRVSFATLKRSTSRSPDALYVLVKKASYLERLVSLTGRHFSQTPGIRHLLLWVWGLGGQGADIFNRCRG